MMQWLLIAAMWLTPGLAETPPETAARTIQGATTVVAQQRVAEARVLFNSASVDGALLYDITSWSEWETISRSVNDGGRTFYDRAPQGMAEIRVYTADPGAAVSFVVWRCRVHQRNDIPTPARSAQRAPGDPEVVLADPYPTPIDQGVEYYTVASTAFKHPIAVFGNRAYVDRVAGVQMYLCPSIKLSTHGGYAYFVYVFHKTTTGRVLLTIASGS